MRYSTQVQNVTAEDISPTYFQVCKKFRDQAEIKNNLWHRLLQVFYFYSIPKQIGVKCT